MHVSYKEEIFWLPAMNKSWLVIKVQGFCVLAVHFYWLVHVWVTSHQWLVNILFSLLFLFNSILWGFISAPHFAVWSIYVFFQVIIKVTLSGLLTACSSVSVKCWVNGRQEMGKLCFAKVMLVVCFRFMLIGMQHTCNCFHIYSL